LLSALLSALLSILLSDWPLLLTAGAAFAGDFGAGALRSFSEAAWAESWVGSVSDVAIRQSATEDRKRPEVATK
jgi:hypothetical protein